MSTLTRLEVRHSHGARGRGRRPDGLLTAREPAMCRGCRTSNKRHKSENQKEKTSNVSNP